jgi:hypothetical protein
MSTGVDTGLRTEPYRSLSAQRLSERTVYKQLISFQKWFGLLLRLYYEKAKVTCALSNAYGQHNATGWTGLV